MPESGPQNGAGKWPRQQQAFRKTGPLSGSQNGPRFFCEIHSEQPTNTNTTANPAKAPKTTGANNQKALRGNSEQLQPWFRKLSNGNLGLGLWKDPPSRASKDPSFQRSPQFKGFAPEALQRSGSKEPGPLGGWVSGCDSKPPSPLEAQLHSHPEGRPKAHLAQPQTPPEVLQNPP